MGGWGARVGGLGHLRIRLVDSKWNLFTHWWWWIPSKWWPCAPSGIVFALGWKPRSKSETTVIKNKKSAFKLMCKNTVSQLLSGFSLKKSTGVLCCLVAYCAMQRVIMLTTKLENRWWNTENDNIILRNILLLSWKITSTHWSCIFCYWGSESFPFSLLRKHF